MVHLKLLQHCVPTTLQLTSPSHLSESPVHAFSIFVEFYFYATWKNAAGIILAYIPPQCPYYVILKIKLETIFIWKQRYSLDVIMPLSQLVIRIFNNNNRFCWLRKSPSPHRGCQAWDHNGNFLLAWQVPRHRVHGCHARDSCGQINSASWLPRTALDTHTEVQWPSVGLHVLCRAVQPAFPTWMTYCFK